MSLKYNIRVYTRNWARKWILVNPKVKGSVSLSSWWHLLFDWHNVIQIGLTCELCYQTGWYLFIEKEGDTPCFPICLIPTQKGSMSIPAGVIRRGLKRPRRGGGIADPEIKIISWHDSSHLVNNDSRMKIVRRQFIQESICLFQASDLETN